MDKIKAPLIVEEVTDAGWQRKIRGTCEAISPTYPVGNISLSKELYDGPTTGGEKEFHFRETERSQAFSSAHRS